MIRDVAQELTEMFFQDIEESIRELGVSDVGGPKRMRKLASMFYGRIVVCSEAIAAGDRAALSQVFARNVRPDIARWDEAGNLSAHVMTEADSLAAQPLDAILSKGVDYPLPLSLAQ